MTTVSTAHYTDDDLDEWIAATKDLMARLPTSHLVVFRQLFLFLHEVAQYEELNAMGSKNLGTVFAPNVVALKADASLTQILAATPSCVAFTVKCIENATQLCED